MTGQTHAYSSPDGLTWTEHTKADWGDESVVSFKGRLWMFGGLDYQARLPERHLVLIRWRGRRWATPPGPYAAATVVVHRDRLWLFGGANHIADDRSTDGFLNDVWVSDDGIVDVGDAGRTWAPRAKAGVVVFNDELYLLGGQGTADVWRSSNGRDWTQLAPEADWSPRHDFARLVYSDRLWVGGWTDKSTNALNDVWYSMTA